MKILLTVIAGIIGIFAFARSEKTSREKKIEEAFAERPQRTPEEFYQTYFMTLGVPEDVVLGVREILEVQLDADLSRMIDADDFSKNLCFFWDFDSMADVEIVCALEARFEIKISDKEAENAVTVRDIVELVWNKVEEKT